MTMAQKTGDGLTNGMRWGARVVGLLASGLFLQFMIRSGVRMLPALSWSGPREMPLFLAMVVSVAGVLIAWRWETAGGTMTVGGAVAIIVLAYVGAGLAIVPAAMMLTLPLFVAGVLCLACCWRIRTATRSRGHKHQARRMESTAAVDSPVA
jgi:hypothetical protein